MAVLVDTNILVYVYDPAEPRKQKIAAATLDRHLRDGSLRIPHQAIVEFVAVTTRRRAQRAAPLLTREGAFREAEAMLLAFEILYPEPDMVRTALRGAAAYQLSWYDAHLWAYAEHYGLSALLTEDFEHDRLYGTVRVVNPFVAEA